MINRLNVTEEPVEDTIAAVPLEININIAEMRAAEQRRLEAFKQIAMTIMRETTSCFIAAVAAIDLGITTLESIESSSTSAPRQF